MAPAAQLSSEPHSFSRVFTGAFFEALAGMLTAKAANPSSPTEQELLTVSQEMGDILVAGARQAPVVSNFYAQVAAGMVQASASKNPGYPPILKGVFVRRSILSLHAATTVEALHQSVVAAAIAPRSATGPSTTWTRSHYRPRIMVSINRCSSRPRRIRGSFSRPLRRPMQAQWTPQVRSLLLEPLSTISSVAGGSTTRASDGRRRGSSMAIDFAPTSWSARAVPCDCAGCCLIAVCSIARVARAVA